jgi:hypothetical protein
LLSLISNGCSSLDLFAAKGFRQLIVLQFDCPTLAAERGVNPGKLTRRHVAVSKKIFKGVLSVLFSPEVSIDIGHGLSSVVKAANKSKELSIAPILGWV